MSENISVDEIKRKIRDGLFKTFQRDASKTEIFSGNSENWLHRDWTPRCSFTRHRWQHSFCALQ